MRDVARPGHSFDSAPCFPSFIAWQPYASGPPYGGCATSLSRRAVGVFPAVARRRQLRCHRLNEEHHWPLVIPLILLSEQLRAAGWCCCRLFSLSPEMAPFTVEANDSWLGICERDTSS